MPILDWFKEIYDKKRWFIRNGLTTWEFWLICLTICGLLLSVVVVPGLYAVEDTTPDRESYAADIAIDGDGKQATQLTVDCRASDFLTPESQAFVCEFEFVDGGGERQIYDDEYIADATGEQLLTTDWSRQTDATTFERESDNLDLNSDFIHEADDGENSIHGNFTVEAPRNPDTYDFSIILGEYFGEHRGDSQSATIFSESETSTLETREYLLPFQRLFVIGVLLSVLKLWIDLFDRIAKKSDL